MNGRKFANTIGLLASVSLTTLSCDRSPFHREHAWTHEKADLGGEVAAVVGDRRISTSLVAAVAAAQSSTVTDALSNIVRDELAAIGAEQRGLSKSATTAWRITSARAGLVTRLIQQRARAEGLPSDREVQELSERYWSQVDRPEAVRVVHALVLRPKKDVDVPAAKARAASMASHLAAISTDQFEREANAFSLEPPLSRKVEALPPFIADGRLVEGGGSLEESFSKAAFALASPGATSGVVETSYGYHVIRLVERLPEARLSVEARRTAFAEEVIAIRARRALRALLTRMRERQPVAIDSRAEELMRPIASEADASAQAR